MAGIPQGRDINEDGPKGVTLVTIAENGDIHMEERATCVAQFERVEVDVGGLDDWSDLAEAIERALGQARDRAIADQLVARVRLVGATPLPPGGCAATRTSSGRRRRSVPPRSAGPGSRSSTSHLPRRPSSRRRASP